MKQIQIKTYNTKPQKELPKVNHHEMKARVKTLRGEMIRLNWTRKGELFSMVGNIKQLYKVQFDYVITGRPPMRIRYDEVVNVELIK